MIYICVYNTDARARPVIRFCLMEMIIFSLVHSFQLGHEGFSTPLFFLTSTSTRSNNIPSIGTLISARNCMLPCPRCLSPIDLIRRSTGVCGSWFGKCRIGGHGHGDMWQLAYPISNGDEIRQRSLGQLPRLGVRDCVIGCQYRVHKTQEIKLRWGVGFAAFSRSSILVVINWLGVSDVQQTNKQTAPIIISGLIKVFISFAEHNVV